MYNKLLITKIILVFITLLQFSQAFNCVPTTNGNIENVTEFCDDLYLDAGDGCVLLPDPLNNVSAIECVGDTICSVELVNSSCTVCVEGRYGTDCLQKAVCASECSYNRNSGCTSDTGTKEECNLLNLKISNHTRMQGTQGVDKEIFIKITVNLDESDVNVTVYGPGNCDLFFINVTDGGVYMYKFVLGLHQPGMYIFTATALLNQTTTYINKSTSVEVIVYEPVAITSVQVKYNTGEEKTIDGNTVSMERNQNITELICSAEGMGVCQDLVSWMENGGKIGQVSTENNMYQLKSSNDSKTISTLVFPYGKDSGTFTCEAENRNNNGDQFYDVRTIELTLKPIPQESYARESAFIIAVCVLGIVLFLTITGFVLAFIYTSKMHKAQIKKLKYQSPNTIDVPTPQNKSHDNSSFDPPNQNLQRVQNNYKHHPSPGLSKGKKSATTMPGNRQSYYPGAKSNRQTASMPIGMRPEYENANQLDQRPVQIPISSRESQAILRTDGIPLQPQLDESIYDQVEGDRPPLPKPNNPRHQSDDESLYLQPDDGIYQDTLHLH